MKKLALFTLSALMTLGLASCGGDTTTSGSYNYTEEDFVAALDKASNLTICATNSGTPILPGEVTTLSGDDNDYLVLTTHQSVRITGKGSVTVNLEWGYDSTNTHISKITDKKDDDNHKIMYFNYSTEEDIEDVSFKATLTVDGYDSSLDANFNVTLGQNHVVFEEFTLAEFYSTETGKFPFLDDDYNISKNKNADGELQRYYYVSLSGKVVYVAKDKNFAIMGDGEYSVYLYKIADFDDVAVGNYISVGGEVAHYNGALQISFISRVSILEDHSNIEEPIDYQETTISEIQKHGQMSMYHMYPVSLDVTYGGGISATTKVTGRFTFTVKDGEDTLTVAYDYHTGFGADLKDALLDVAVGTTLSVKGRLIYNNGTGTFTGNGTKWQLLPVSASDIAVVQ